MEETAYTTTLFRFYLFQIIKGALIGAPSHFFSGSND